ncbi:MAG: 2,3-bisphosphoglycerate-independent phosphoglycerate mutase [Methanosarcinales archaeon]|nr:MAG: 2,3-bisphosphoglycerate-independent phosphoglycerate mutase [Euryarchaeota archaeon 55_53]MDN5294527.1 2,3-bisphosphoglycerate-independent phosphoglycerate mutase [Methanosarcinales archaeon]
MLVVLDGFGLSESERGNAIAAARTPNIDHLFSSYPFTTLCAHGEAVGLPEGQMGNSEVGHLNIGAGRIVYQDIVRISKAIEDGSFFQNEALLSAVRWVKEHRSILHLLGLVSPGGVHSHQEHLYALLELARMHDVPVMVHAFLDGRDTPPRSAHLYIRELEKRLHDGQVVGSVCGRYYAMDRDRRWERTRLAYDAVVNGVSEYRAQSGYDAVIRAYERGENDEFVRPTVVAPHRMRDEDAVIFFNFRADRARQLTLALTDRAFKEFPVSAHPFFVAFTRYEEDIPLNVAFDKQHLINTFGEWISRHGLTQLRIAETEKYAHVTYFFSGGREEPFEGEERILIPSPKVATYDLKPEMSAYEVTDAVVEHMGRFDVVVMNYANCDMVGHTGIMEAAVRAVEAVDECVGRVMERTLSLGGTLVLTADHGNAEQMLDDGTPHTAHTNNPVPFVIARRGFACTLRDGGILGDIAPTLLELLGLPVPEEMSGRSLIESVISPQPHP